MFTVTKVVLLWLWSKISPNGKNSIIKRATNAFVNWGAITIGKINWTSKRVMHEEDFDVLKQKLKDNYYIILTMHRGHMTSYAIAITNFFLTGKFGYYAHALMNVEDEVTSDDDYRFIEATGKGVHYSTFPEAFDAQTSAVALLKPKSMTIEKWTAALDRSKTYLGKPYDTLFDLSNDQSLSCVELVRCALQGEPNYTEDFKNFEAMIAGSKNLAPQMFLDCPDFEIVWEIRH